MTFTAVQVGSRIDGNVVTVKPQVYVELIGM
jgi:hypothetical protein